MKIDCQHQCLSVRETYVQHYVGISIISVHFTVCFSPLATKICEDRSVLLATKKWPQIGFVDIRGFLE